MCLSPYECHRRRHKDHNTLSNIQYILSYIIIIIIIIIPIILLLLLLLLRATARCGLWPVEQYLSIFPYPSPALSIFSLPTLEDLFLLNSIQSTSGAGRLLAFTKIYI
jgi:hypothetical protein